MKLSTYSVGPSEKLCIGECVDQVSFVNAQYGIVMVSKCDATSRVSLCETSVLTSRNFYLTISTSQLSNLLWISSLVYVFAEISLKVYLTALKKFSIKKMLSYFGRN